MPLKLNYKAGLTLFYHLLVAEHEAADKGFNRIRSNENVYEDSPHGNQFKSILAVLRVCGHAKRVKALAWVKREMLIKAHVLIEDSPIYRRVMEEFQISEKEVNQAMVEIS